MRSAVTRWLFVPMLSLFAGEAFAGFKGETETVVRVKKNSAAQNPDGLTWATAYPTIQAGIEACEDLGGGEVWVSTGRYNEARPPSGALALVSGVALYGGFAGSEIERAQRDWQKHLTIIDGSLANNGAPAGPVVVGATGATLDGFRIAGGRALSGGGMLNNFASPRIENCVFTDNQAIEFGAGMWNRNGAAPTIVNCIFYNNTAQIHGGAIQNDSCSPTIVGCTIVENFAEFRGGGIYNNTASFPIITNCIIYGNTNENIGNTGTSNPSLTYSCLSETEFGIGNILEDPQFINAATGNFLLQPFSPCVDTGRDTSTDEFASVTTDIKANARGFDGVDPGFITGDGSDYDMGAFEYTGAYTFHSADTNGDFDMNLQELLRVVQFFNLQAYHCEEGTLDGYAAGPGECENGTPHDSDFSPSNFVINLQELLRLIQIFNGDGGYLPDATTPDGFRAVFYSNF